MIADSFGEDVAALVQEVTDDKSLDKARQAWISRLIDLSQRNNLLYFRPLKVGTVVWSGSGE